MVELSLTDTSLDDGGPQITASATVTVHSIRECIERCAAVPNDICKRAIFTSKASPAGTRTCYLRGYAQDIRVPTHDHAGLSEAIISEWSAYFFIWLHSERNKKTVLGTRRGGDEKRKEDIPICEGKLIFWVSVFLSTILPFALTTSHSFIYSGFNLTRGCNKFLEICYGIHHKAESPMGKNLLPLASRPRINRLHKLLCNLAGWRLTKAYVSRKHLH